MTDSRLDSTPPPPRTMATELRVGVWLGLILAAGWLLWLLAPVLTPFLAAALLAYLGDPLVDRLETYRLSRGLAVTVVFLVIFALLLLLLLFLLPLLEGQLSALLQRLPGYLDLIKTDLLPWLNRRLGVDPEQFNFSLLQAELTRHASAVGGLLVGVLTSVTQSSALLLGWLMNLVLIPVITFYLLRDWDRLVSSLHDLLPRAIEPLANSLARESDAVLGAFLKGQLVVMLALGAIYSLGLFLVGLDFALLIGLLAGVVSFVPYLGLIVGMSAALLAALFQFTDWLPFIGVLLVFGVGQLIETVLLTPLLVGDRIGLHPVAVIFAVLAGGQLFGFFGVLLALPVAAVIMVLVRRSHQSYLRSPLYSD